MSRSLPRPGAALGLAPGLECRLDGCDELVVRVDGREARLPRQALAVLAAARDARPLQALVAALGAEAPGAVAWIEATSLVGRLYALGALVDASAAEAPGPAPPPRGREIEMHIELLDDLARTARFVAAIERSVRPGDVVVDLGSGTGVLAMAAARAGAARVHAIEASAFAAVTAAIVGENGYRDRIDVIRAWSHEVVLTQPADVLVAEIIGNDPLGEGVLRYVPDAVQRLLKPGGRVLPARIAVDLQLVEPPEDFAMRHRVGAGRLARWRGAYGWGFDALEVHAAAAARRLHVAAEEVARWRALAGPRPLFTVDLRAGLAAERTAMVTLEADAASPRQAVVVGTELQFAEDDGEPPFRCGGHWRVPVLLLPARAHTRRWAVRARWGALASQVGLEAEALD